MLCFCSTLDMRYNLTMKSAVILTGGEGSRLGGGKPSFRFGGRPLIDIVVDKLIPLFDEIIVAGSARADVPGVKTAMDIIPGKGPLSGIHAGLKAAGGGCAFVTACDMPFTDPHFVEELYGLWAGEDALVPRHDWNIEPLHAVYSTFCISVIERILRGRSYRVKYLLDRINVRYIPVDEPRCEYMFFNINTPDDAERAEKLAERYDVET